MLEPATTVVALLQPELAVDGAAVPVASGVTVVPGVTLASGVVVTLTVGVTAPLSADATLTISGVPVGATGNVEAA